MLELHTPVKYVKGVGPRLADVLASKGILTVEDLLYYLPFRYEDRLNPRGIGELRPGEMASIVAEVRGSGLFQTKKARIPIFQMTAGQGRQSIKCIWFHGGYLKGKFEPGQVVALYGKVEQDAYGRNALQIVQPQFEILEDARPPEMAAPQLAISDEGNNGHQPAERADVGGSLEIGRIVPIYEAAGQGRITTRWFRKIIHGALENLAEQVPDAIPPAICKRLDLAPRREAFWKAHWPDPGESFDHLQQARTPAHRRLIFEELFFLELGLELKRQRMKAQPGIGFSLDERVRQAIKKILPFHPTDAQKRVLKEIAGDMSKPTPMRRLLQGDVGSGKTIVAFQAAIIAIENGYQVALMAPTEILATQHYLSARRILEQAGYRIVLLTGSLEQDRKRAVRRHIARGDAQLVIGTHALIESTVEFDRPGLVIVDEQHRFGVLQRMKLMKKTPETAEESKTPAAEPDVLVMTATPIPRTLALTLYGDLDVSILDELPPGRTPIVTRRISDDRADEVWAFLRKQVNAGHQAYVVYPVIEEGVVPAAETANLPKLLPDAAPKTGLKAAIKMYDELRKRVFPSLRVGLLHGRLPADQKEEVMRRFQAGEIQVLVSTTVIEVGVDVPNANLMVVEHAERFGLSQLHQLRGRIGRGAVKSYCVLMTGSKITLEAEQRLNTMVGTTDGFKIAETDLELRGPGEFFGTRQAGMPSFRVANLLRDLELLQTARREAETMLAGPSKEISQQEIDTAVQHLHSHWQRRYGLVEVG